MAIPTPHAILVPPGRRTKTGGCQPSTCQPSACQPSTSSPTLDTTTGQSSSFIFIISPPALTFIPNDFSISPHLCSALLCPALSYREVGSSHSPLTVHLGLAELPSRFDPSRPLALSSPIRRRRRGRLHVIPRPPFSPNTTALLSPRWCDGHPATSLNSAGTWWHSPPSSCHGFNSPMLSSSISASRRSLAPPPSPNMPSESRPRLP